MDLHVMSIDIENSSCIEKRKFLPTSFSNEILGSGAVSQSVSETTHQCSDLDTSLENIKHFEACSIEQAVAFLDTEVLHAPRTETSKFCHLT